MDHGNPLMEDDCFLFGCFSQSFHNQKMVFSVNQWTWTFQRAGAICYLTSDPCPATIFRLCKQRIIFMPQDIQYLLLTFYSNLANLEISLGRTDIHPLIENTQPNDFHIYISKRPMSQLQLSLI